MKTSLHELSSSYVPERHLHTRLFSAVFSPAPSLPKLTIPLLVLWIDPTHDPRIIIFVLLDIQIDLLVPRKIVDQFKERKHFSIRFGHDAFDVLILAR